MLIIVSSGDTTNVNDEPGWINSKLGDELSLLNDQFKISSRSLEINCLIEPCMW